MKKIYVLDVSAMIYKGFFGFKDLQNSEGAHTGALYYMVLKIAEIIKKFGKPDIIIAAMDSKKAKLERKELYENYKSGRPPKPDELKKQIEMLGEFFSFFNINIVDIPGQEADDICGSVVKQFKSNKTYIFTTDKDITQVVGINNCSVVILKSKKQGGLLELSTKEEVKEYIGIEPKKIPDLFGLMGDKADAIPGVNGIGEKTGIKLIEKYGFLENLYLKIDELKGKQKENLLKYKEDAYLSRKLATINTRIKLKEPMIKWNGINPNFFDLMEKLEMRKCKGSLINVLSEMEEKNNNKFYTIIIKDHNLKDRIGYCEIFFEEDKWKTLVYKSRLDINFLNNEVESIKKLKGKERTIILNNNKLAAINSFLLSWGIEGISYFPFAYKNMNIKELIKEMNDLNTSIIMKEEETK